MKLFKSDAEFAALHSAALIHADEATIEAFESLKRRRIVAARLRRNLATARARMAAIAVIAAPVAVAEVAS